MKLEISPSSSPPCPTSNRSKQFRTALEALTTTPSPPRLYGLLHRPSRHRAPGARSRSARAQRSAAALLRPIRGGGSIVTDNLRSAPLNSSEPRHRRKRCVSRPAFLPRRWPGNPRRTPTRQFNGRFLQLRRSRRSTHCCFPGIHDHPGTPAILLQCVLARRVPYSVAVPGGGSPVQCGGNQDSGTRTSPDPRVEDSHAVRKETSMPYVDVGTRTSRRPIKIPYEVTGVWQLPGAAHGFPMSGTSGASGAGP